MRMVRKGQRMVRRIFEELLEHPEQLPRRYHDRAGRCGMERSVCDYVAGMTDRYAQDEYIRLFHPGTSA